jgi:hypothetical protein
LVSTIAARVPLALLLGFALLVVSPEVGAVDARTPARLFDGGQTFNQFLNTVVAQRALWHANAGRAVPRNLVDRLMRVRDGLQVLVVAEDWCPDSVNTVPYVAKVAAASAVEVRIIQRAQGQPVMTLHRTPDGRTATPTIVLLRDRRDVGAWVERPAVLQSLFLSMATNPENVQRVANRQTWYDADAGVTTLTEVVLLAERSAVSR